MNANLRLEIGNPGRLALPGVTVVFMCVMFGLPGIMLVATTWSMLGEYPVLLPLVWLGAAFPVLAVYVLKRLMARYRLRLFDDGAVELDFPFRSVRIGRDELAAIRRRGAYVSQGNVQRSWIEFISPGNSALATLPGNTFTTEDLERFFAALRGTNPAVAVEV